MMPDPPNGGFTAPGARTPSDTIAEEFSGDVAHARKRPDPVAPRRSAPVGRGAAWPALGALASLLLAAFWLGRRSGERRRQVL